MKPKPGGLASLAQPLLLGARRAASDELLDSSYAERPGYLANPAKISTHLGEAS